MKTVFAVLALGIVSSTAYSAGPKFPLDSIEVNHADKASLQRGASTFVNYCMGCHSASYHRYSRMAVDLGLPDDLVKKNLIFTTDENGEQTKVGALMTNNMDSDYAKQVFGTEPPNLALISRSRNANWLYTYMRTFYEQPERSGLGSNNLVFPDVGMPNVLWELQGKREAVFEIVTDENGQDKKQFVELRQVGDGKLTEDEFDALVYDLVNFLDYLGDPIKSERHRIGFWVLLFLGVFTAFAYMLKREYWKDVH
ncbi:MAG: cytochrome c1 [Pseudomonadota bacterium]